MERTKLVNFLRMLHNEEQKGNTTEIYEERCMNVCAELNCTYEGIKTSLPKIFSDYFSKESPVEWKSICLSFYILHLLSLELNKSDTEVLSVHQSKIVKNCIEQIVTIGICAKLLPNLPLYTRVALYTKSEDIFLDYNILKCTTLGLCEFMKNPNLRLLILPDNLKAILIATYQIAFCPLKQPAVESNSDCVMSQEIYQRLLEEKKKFSNLLVSFKSSIHPTIYVRETMSILQPKLPVWFKKAILQFLTSIIRSKNGIENISVVLLDGVSNDSTQTWKILDVISRLILDCRKFPDFKENTTKQVLGLLDKVTDTTLVYERLFTHCTKVFFEVDPELSKDLFVRPVITNLLYFTYKSHKFKDNEDLTGNIIQTVRLIHGMFAEHSVEHPELPVDLLTPVLAVLYRFYVITSNKFFKSVNEDLKSILNSYLEKFRIESFFVFDSFLFNIGSNEILPLRNDIHVKLENNRILLNVSEHAVYYSVTENADFLLELLKSKTHLLVNLFGFLLNCLTNKDKYFKKINEDLLKVEEEFMNEYIERNLAIYKLLSELAEIKDVQKQITETPEDIIKYMEMVLNKSIELSTHKNSDADSNAFQSVFTVLMILHSLVASCSKDNLGGYKVLIEPLRKMYKDATDSETKNIVNEILDSLDKGQVKSTRFEVEEVKSELDKTLEDICDPLLPTRGHGLMTLTKLVEKKDHNVMERKQYVLNIFQQNLKNEDSYIYLSAIGGLAALADVFPDTIINILCEEFSDFSRKQNDDGHEVRIKLGETLVRLTKSLGDMAPKYKSLLLNTFLIGVKDEDDLIRTSSLSNLGEICRVLGYKLGTVVTEVLVCVHAIISTDKSPQARRAAVTVIRQLFVGLEQEMIAFLKDDILPIYRTLKDIYSNDKDDVMRLQAQLALEELNENMKKFVFPNPALHAEKKIIMLD